MTKQFSNYSDLLTFTRASKGHALRPVSYGNELVTNGTFDSDISSWANGAANFTTLSYDTGTLEIVASGGNARANQGPISVEAGKVYLLSAEVTQKTLDGSSFIHLGTLLGGAQIKANLTQGDEVGVTTFVFVAPTNDLYIQLGALNGSTVNYDNISVKEVLFDQPDGTLTLFEHPENVPRVEYDADGNLLGLLIEEARTNLVNKASFDGWTKLNTTVNSASTITSPDETNTAEKVIRTASGSAFVYLNNSVIAGRTASVFAKAAEYSYLYCQLGHGGWKFTVDLTTKQVSGVNGFSESDITLIEQYPDGWIRVAVTIPTGVPLTYFGFRGNSTGSIYDGTFDGTSGIYAWGGMIEDGSFATSYIKSIEGSRATRSADVASIPVADFGYNQSAGTVVAEVRAEDTSVTTGNTFYSLKKDNSNFIRLDRYTTAFAFRVKDGGTFQVQAAISGGEPNTTDLHKVSAVYSTNDFAYVYDGGTVGTDSAGTVPDGITTLHLSEGDFNGHIKSIKYYPRRLTDAQLVDLTS